MAEKRPALGRGLSALIPDAPPLRGSGARARRRHRSAAAEQVPAAHAHGRRAGSRSSRESIRANGIIQPIVVRKVGERLRDRRRRAPLARRRSAPGCSRCRSSCATSPTIGCSPRRSSRTSSARISTRSRKRTPIAASPTSSTSRRSRSPTRSARIARRSRTSCGCSSCRDESARASRPAGCRWGTRARSLALPDEAVLLRVARDVVARQSLGARDRSADPEGRRAAAEQAAAGKDVHTRAAEDSLRFALGTRVRIVRKGKGGRIEIDFTSEDELQRLYELLTDGRDGAMTAMRTARIEARTGSRTKRCT